MPTAMQDNQLQSSELLRLSIIYRVSMHFQISERRLDLVIRIEILPAFDKCICCYTVLNHNVNLVFFQ